jgi:uncharacterized protein YxeA
MSIKNGITPVIILLTLIEGDMYRTIFFKQTTCIYFTIIIVIIIGAILFCNDNNPAVVSDKNSGYILIIENGAQSIKSDQTLTYTAKLVDGNGNETVPEKVTWSSLKEKTCTINGSGRVNATGAGVSTIAAHVVLNGVTYTARVPLNITLAIPQAMTVLPGAIIALPGENYELNVVEFSVQPGTYTFLTSDADVASVTSEGVVTALKPGSVVITVKSSTGNSLSVPVEIVVFPSITLPVV